MGTEQLLLSNTYPNITCETVFDSSLHVVQ